LWLVVVEGVRQGRKIPIEVFTVAVVVVVVE
jgi:hypothetical protein